METGYSSYDTLLNRAASLRPVEGHNGPLPSMLRLPTELAVNILQFALPPVDITLNEAKSQVLAYMRTLYAIRLIAKRCREIIDGTPTFWKFVMSTLPLRINEATISRSGDGPLTVVYAFRPFGEGEPQGFVDSLAHTFPRWTAYCGPLVLGYFDKPAPHLQTIVLWQGETYIPVFELLGGSATNLRHVDVSHISIQWKTGLFAQLKVLKLKGVFDKEHRLTTTHLLDALRASPGLEHIDLDCMYATIDHSLSLPVITHPHLRRIHLHYCDRGFAGAILRQIRAPSCTDLYLFIFPMENEPNLPILWNEDLGPIEDVLRAIHSRNGSSKITPDEGSFGWQSPAEDVEDLPTFSVFIVRHATISCISWVERILHGDPGLSIGFSYNAYNTREELERIKPMRCITRMEIGNLCDFDKCLLALKFIGEPLNTDPALPSLPCLQELLLAGGEWTAQNVLDMVRSRFSSPLWESTERTPLTISMSREGFAADGSPRPISDLTTLVRIRETDGVECVRFVGSEEPYGTLAITWDEEKSAPAWG